MDNKGAGNMVTHLNKITIRQQSFILPEGIYSVETRFGIEIYDERGFPCSLYESGYTSAVDDSQPYVTTWNQRNLPLKKDE